MAGKFIKGWFYHGVKVSKWENVNSSGKRSVSFSIEKSYKDQNDGTYKSSKTFFSDDLDSLIQCLFAAKRESIKEIFPREQTAAPDPYSDGKVPDSEVPPFNNDPKDEEVPF